MSMMKRVFDVFVSLVSLVLFFPLFLVIAPMILLDDFGPIFYRQVRVGLKGRTFQMYKFRSMRVDADKIGPYSTSPNDARITKVGKFLRRSSLDELPQMLNVLLGDMSIVGPRPNVPQQQALYEPCIWDKRNSVKPGITGLAQATKRSEATAEERDRLDMDYVDNVGVFFDLKIMFMTVQQVFRKGGN